MGNGNRKTRSVEAGGLAYWMSRVLREAARAEKKESVDAIHDLRVALRRCRTIGEGLMELDNHPDWALMRKAGGKLFDRVGELRDLHVLQGWVERLAPADDPLRGAMEKNLESGRRDALAAGRHAVRRFDRKQWKKWARILPARTRRIPPDGLVFQLLALASHQQALELHRLAVRGRSRVAWHKLRLGVKRFRYAVENFLPGRHAAWGADLKRVQTLLGDVHDLDVLREQLRAAGPAFSGEARVKWLERIEAERSKRLTEYKSLATGKDSLWQVWRQGLPVGKQLETAPIAWFRAWIGFRDSDWQQRRRLVSLALQLFDGLGRAGTNVVFQDARNRRILYAAALMQHAGRHEGEKGHHKRSYKMIRDQKPPVGWSERDMLWAALVARYHRGAEPRDNHAGFATLAPADRKTVVWLAAVLRLADGLVICRPQPVTSVQVESSGAIHVWADSLPTDPATMELLAEKKHLLEIASHRPVMLHAAPARRPQLKSAYSAA